LLTGNITRDEELISISSHFVPDAGEAADAGTPNRESDLAQPPITARKAVVKAAANLQVAVAENSLVSVTVPEGARRKQTLRSEALSRPANVQLVWLPLNENALRLCWQVVCNVPSTVEHYLIVLDAETGEVLVRRGLTERLEDASYNVFTSDSPSPFTPGWPNPTNGQPALVERQLIRLSALDTNASPAGWVPDGPSPTTTGTNVDAFLCRELETDNDGNWVPDRPRPLSTDRVFDFRMNLQNEDPEVYADASTVELFYWANWFHDRTYQLGFTEAAGNFQVTNFNRGGLQNDPVLGLVQAGANQGEEDNAAF